MKRFSLIFLSLIIVGALQAQAATIHTRFFESHDVLLKEDAFRIFSLAPLQGEKITLVVYGLEGEVIPTLTVFDPAGLTIAENLNRQQSRTVAVQFRANYNGMYTYLVSRQTEAQGLIRVMVFEGDPIDYDITLLDFASAFEPSRAFLIAGDEQEPLGVFTEIIQPEDENAPQFTYYVSRGDEFTLPPDTERYNEVDEFSWSNNFSDRFYTINVRPIPEAFQSTASNRASFFSLNQQFLEVVFDYYLTIGNGSVPVRVERNICEVVLSNTIILRDLPTILSQATGQINAGTPIEIVGTNANGSWLQIVDASEDDGNSWIPRIAYPAGTNDCQRVTSVYIPRRGGGGGGSNPAGENPIPPPPFVPPNNNGGGGGGGGGVNIEPLDPVIPPVFQPPLCANPGDFIVVNLPPNVANYLGQICNEEINGNDLNNVITGSDGNDTLNGDNGNDDLSGEAGNDIINGGAGFDTYRATGNGTTNINMAFGTAIGDQIGNDLFFGIEAVEGGAGDDQIIGNDFPNQINGNDGNDYILGFGDNDTLDGGAGNDTVCGGVGNDIIRGGAGDDSLCADGGSDTVFGDGGNDTIDITNAHGNTSINTGGGNDRIIFNAGISGNFTLTSGGGIDTLDFSGFGLGISIDLNDTTNTQSVAAGLFIRLNNLFHAIIGTSADDTIQGNTLDNLILGGAGNDTLYGASGSDTVDGESGVDVLFGGWDNGSGGFGCGAAVCDDVGNDSVVDTGGDNGDTLFGGNNNSLGGEGDDIGNDTVRDTGGNTDTLYGGNKNGPNGIGADIGNDFVIDEGGDSDTLWGGNFNVGNIFVVFNDDGNDTVQINNNIDASVFGGNNNSGSGHGSDGNDLIIVNNSGSSTIHGGNQNSNFFGGSGAGNDGNDTITLTDSSNNVIYGGNDNRGATVGNSNDGSDSITLQGNSGASTVHGGNNNSGANNITGNDTRDVITDTSGLGNTFYGGNNNVGLGGGATADDDGADTFNTADGDDADNVFGDNQAGGGTGGVDVFNCDGSDSPCTDGNG